MHLLAGLTRDEWSVLLSALRRVFSDSVGRKELLPSSFKDHSLVDLHTQCCVSSRLSAKRILELTHIVWLLPLLRTSTTCLFRSRVELYLLRERGYEAQLFIGVRRGEGKVLEAHAWVECPGISEDIRRTEGKASYRVIYSSDMEILG